MKCFNNGKLHEEHFCKGLLKIRNAPKEDGLSPAQILYGHSMRTLVPTHYESFSPKWKEIADLLHKRDSIRFSTHEGVRRRVERAFVVFTSTVAFAARFELLTGHWNVHMHARSTRRLTHSSVHSLRDKIMKNYNFHAKDLPPIKIGCKIRVQNVITKLWVTFGIVENLVDVS
ncbi:uncharacterized protein LOC123313153 [Coccinella septempunctata]|uniref:uncharacterized protein LOC123313153 n=1 Tax=Coccinella septempunctata TaxID=41139 RepID=UPI001D0715A4|nr:uncharacterized protein LOC123313153 [Coccinella septempunctata]